MFKYKILSLSNIKLNKKIIDKILKSIYKNINLSQNWTLNIVFETSDSIKNLNKNYRNIDKVTDVLSFHYYDDFSLLKKDDVAWEIIMCEEKIKEQAIEYSLWEEKEFYKLLIHSILHILWYDHENDIDYKEMQKKEDIIWQEVFEK